MKHKYKVIHFVNDKQVCEWKEEKINSILYLNDFYNFIDEKQFDSSWGHRQGSKNEIYSVLKKCLKALDIIIDKGVNMLNFIAHFIISTPEYEEYQYYVDNFEKYNFGAFLLSKQDFELLREVAL